MNKYVVALLIDKNRKKLDKMIEEEKPYEEILKQSKKLDKYIYLNLKNQIEEKNKT